MGSALAALDGRDSEIGEQKIIELVKACDKWLELPARVHLPGIQRNFVRAQVTWRSHSSCLLKVGYFQ